MADWDRARPDDVRPEEWDAGLRLSDRVNFHLLADREGNRGRWIAARLADGGANVETTYPTRDEAIAHQLMPRHHVYVRLPWGAMSPRAAHLFMATHREMYARWHQALDVPEAHIIVPARTEQLARIAPRLRREQQR